MGLGEAALGRHMGAGPGGDTPEAPEKWGRDRGREGQCAGGTF